MNLFQIMQGVQSGTLDAKREACEMLNRMPPAQRRAAVNILPKVEAMAKQVGVSTEGFMNEARAKLL